MRNRKSCYTRMIHKTLTFLDAGRYYRLTDGEGKVVNAMLS